MRVRIAHFAAVLGLATAVLAQDENPRGSATTTIAGSKVTVEYGRPTLQGRTIDALLKDLPADRMWRAGENQVTTLTTATDLLIGGKVVPAGKYSLYVYASVSGSFSLALNGDAGKPLGELWDKAPASMKSEPWPHLEGYESVGTKEVARAPLTAGTAKPSLESFTIAFAPAGSGATMTLSWGDRSYSVDVKPASK